MLSNYKKSHKFVSDEIFFLGAPNKTGDTIEDMDKKLLALNLFSNDIIAAAQSNSFLEQIAITYIISKVFHLGNCERQSFALFMHILHEGHFNKSLEIILINGNSIVGPHRCVVADRDQTSNLNDLSTWQNATYLDTWNNEILFDNNLTSLTKEQFASKGGVSGKVELISLYRRQEKLAKIECVNLINFLNKAKSKFTVSMLKIIKQSYPNEIENLITLDEHSLIDQIHTEISNDISIYEAMIVNESSKEKTLKHRMSFFQEKQNSSGAERQQDKEFRILTNKYARSLNTSCPVKVPERAAVSPGITMFPALASELDNIEIKKLNIGTICLSFEKAERYDYRLNIDQDGIRKDNMVMFISSEHVYNIIRANKLGLDHLISFLESIGVSASEIAQMLRAQESSLNKAYQ